MTDKAKASAEYRKMVIAECDVKDRQIKLDVAITRLNHAHPRYKSSMEFLTAMQTIYDKRRKMALAGHNEIASIFDKCVCSYCEFPVATQNWGADS